MKQEVRLIFKYLHEVFSLEVNMPERRQYFGFAYLKKCQRGEKAINLVISPEEAAKLSTWLASAAQDSKRKKRKSFDIAIFDAGAKPGKIQITVTRRG